MTALLDLHPDADHPAVSGARAVHDLLDGLEVSAPLSAGEHAGAVAEWERAIRRMQAVKLQLVAAADKANAASLSGMSSTGAWLAKHTTTDSASAARCAKLADDIFDGAALPSATRRALIDGSISTDHAHVITHAKTHLPTTLTPDQVHVVEQSLVESARTLDPVALRKAARRALAAVEPDADKVDAHEDTLVTDEEARARAKIRLTLHDDGDGTLSGHFTVPTLAGSILAKVLDTMTAPRRGRLGASHAQAGDQTLARDWAHERGLAFVELLEHLPTDHLHGKVAATVVITLDSDALTGKLKAAGLDTGDLVSASQARRIACTAGLLPAVLDGPSSVLDLGRSQRLFSQTQRLAGATRWTSCVAEGCQRPYAWCELHHKRSWSHSGRTDLDNAEPLCAFHHHRIHDPAYDHRRLPDGGVRFARRT